MGGGQKKPTLVWASISISISSERHHWNSITLYFSFHNYRFLHDPISNNCGYRMHVSMNFFNILWLTHLMIIKARILKGCHHHFLGRMKLDCWITIFNSVLSYTRGKPRPPKGPRSSSFLKIQNRFLKSWKAQKTWI